MMKKKLNNFLLIIITFAQISFFFNHAYSEENLEYELTAIKLTYNDKKNIVTAVGDAIAKDTKGRIISSPKIIYDKDKQIIKTFNKSIYKDNKNNILKADNFIYDLNKKIITAINNVTYQDSEKNIYQFDQFDYYEIEEKGFGKNLKATNIDKSKIKAPIATINNKTSSTIFENGGVYTTCEYNFKKTNYFFNNFKTLKDCPEWEIVSKKTRHDKKEKMIYHDHPLLKLKGIPVFYSPYFSHPDPTVKRKSGFLTPSTMNNDNYGRNANIPYFYVINDNEDLTFTPIIYFEENPIFLAEYRKVGKKNNLIIDTSYTPGFNKDRSKQTDGSRNHFFLNYQELLENSLFEKGIFNLKIQRVSQKTYLKSHEILTPYVYPDIRYLSNQFEFSLYQGNQNLNILSRIHENLRDSNPTTKYQYTFPNISYNNFFNYFNNDINFNTDFFVTNYGGDSNKIQLANNITTQSEQKIIKSLGVGSIFKTAFYNIDKYNKQISNEKKNLNIENYLTVASDVSYPLYKASSDLNVEQTLEPRFLIKYTPGNMGTSNTGRSFGFSDVYSMNRINDIANPETGFSIGQGLTWELTKKNPDFEKYFKVNYSVGQVLRLNELPQIGSSLNQKSSNIVGSATLSINKNEYFEDQNKNLNLDKLNSNFLELGYGYTLDNDGKDILGQSFNLTKNFKSNYITANYSENRKSLGSSRVGFLEIKKYFTNELSLSASAKKNFITHSTETNSFAALYENDCIRLSASLNKRFYNDDDIKPTNNFFLEIVLKPFGENIAPDISPLLKID